MEFSQEQKLFSQIVRKAWDDDNFKKDLITNPVNVMEQLGYKIEFPKGHTFIVSDQTNESITYINIPKKPKLDSLELTDEQLEMVNGGEFLIALACGAAILTGMAVGVSIYAATHKQTL